MNTELTVQSEESLIKTLQVSVYAGADLDTLKLIVEYCKVLSIDPMLKPFHVVFIDGKNQLFPSISLHRLRAHRCGNFVGMSAPVYGEEVTEMVGKTKMTYPKNCTVTIRKLVAGQIVEFPGHAVWKESFQTTNDKLSPNLIWYKRPYSQLFKCAEADGLKRAYPEISGDVITAEEHNPHLREEHVVTAADAVTQTADAIKAQFSKPEIDCNVNFETGESLTYDGATVTKSGVTNYDPAKDNLLDELHSYINSHNLTVEKVAQLKARYAATSFTELRVDQLTDILDGLKEESK